VDFWSGIVGFFAFDPSLLLRGDLLARVGFQILLLGGSAFFSGSETALFSLSRLDLQRLRHAGHPRAETLFDLVGEPRRLIVSILCGNELVNIAAIANMTSILVTLYGEARAGLITIIVMLPLLLLFGEVTPKTIAVSDARRISADWLAGPLSGWVRIVAPLRWVIRNVSERLTTLLVGSQRAPEHLLQVDEFRSVVEDFAEEGSIKPSARLLIDNLLSAATTEIVQIMTPRTRTAFLDADLGVEELIRQWQEIRHWRIPVYRGSRDDLVGFLHAEDVLRRGSEALEASPLSVDDLLRPVVAVPATKTVSEMIDFFQENDARAAAVLNEFGGVRGFVTLNDALRFVFGPIMERPDSGTDLIEVEAGVYEAPGDARLSEVEHATGWRLVDPRVTTIGGVAFARLGRMPVVDDEVEVEDLVLTVLEMEDRRVARLRIARCGAAPGVGDDRAEEGGAEPVSGSANEGGSEESLR
jgi:CBS domain containing-hemolysin-like protein